MPICMPLFEIVDPDGVRSSIVASSPLSAPRLFHAEGLGGDRMVRLIDGRLVFRRRADQLLVIANGTSFSKAATAPAPAPPPS